MPYTRGTTCDWVCRDGEWVEDEKRKWGILMAFVTLDFETFYDGQFSLSRMTTEEYIRDSRFEVIGVGLKVDDNEPEWFSGTHAEIKAWLLS